MTKVSDTLLKEMIDKLPNPKMRKAYSDKVFSRITHIIYCKQCKKDIGEILSNGVAYEIGNSDKSGMLSYRDRLDGYKGFRCRCGNNSIQSAQEKGIMGANAPGKEDLSEIFNRVKKNPTKVKKISADKVEIDGFILKGAI